MLCLTVIVSLAASAPSQSIDRDNPAPLTGNEIRGNAIGKKVEYYYTFLAGPGEVILTVDSGAKGSFSQLEAQIFDLDAEKLAQVQNLPYPGETSRKVTRASFGAQQPVLLRIFLDRDAGQYLVRVSGAVQAGGPDASFSGQAASTTTPTTTTPDSTASTPTSPEPTSTDPTPVQPVPPTTETSGAADAIASTTNTSAPRASGLKKAWLKLNSAGEVLGLAGIGSLHVEMKDGTAQDIALSTIKKVSLGATTQAPTDGSNITASGEDKLTGWQRLWLKLGAGGDMTNLSGRPLRLEMKDGTVIELGPGKVKKVSFKK